LYVAEPLGGRELSQRPQRHGQPPKAELRHWPGPNRCGVRASRAGWPHWERGADFVRAAA
jgi:hypothetical protein